MTDKSDNVFGILDRYKKGFNKEDVILKLEENGYFNLVVNEDNCVFAEKEFIHQNIIYALVLGIPTTKKLSSPTVHFRMFFRINSPRFSGARFSRSNDNRMIYLDVKVNTDFLVLEKIAEFIAVFIYTIELYTDGLIIVLTIGRTIVLRLVNSEKVLRLSFEQEEEAVFFWGNSGREKKEKKISINKILNTEQEFWRKMFIKTIHEFWEKK